MANMKGIVLAGGSGTRLYPVTMGISKQLLPVYDKPMIYYPISILMLAGIREILIITTPRDLNSFKSVLGDGSHFGLNFSYKIQPEPNGIAEAFIIGEEFIGNDPVCLILGDNIFYGSGLIRLLETSASLEMGARVFGYNVNDPERYGVIEFDKNQQVLSIEEKPDNPKSNCAITGLYFYDNTVVEKAKKLKPSKRGELEITDINSLYIQEDKLEVAMLGRGVAWLDTGTHSSLLDASNFIEVIEKRQALKISCLEEIAYHNGWISKDKLQKNIAELKSSEYAEYLKKLIKE